MRPRKWVLFFALFFILLSVSFYFGKRRLEQNRNLEKLLVEAVAPSIKGRFTLDELRIGLLSVYLRNVRITLPRQSLSIELASIKVGFSFVKLIRSRGDIARSINRIILIEPHLTYSIGRNRLTDTTTAAVQNTPVPEIAFPQSALQTLHIKNGQIDFCSTDGTVMISASSLSGELTNQLFETRFSIIGKFGSARKNLALQGIFSSRDAHHLSIRLAEADIRQPLTFNQLVVSSGLLNGAAEFTFNNQISPDSTDIHGWVSLTNGTLALPGKNQRIEAINAKVLLDSGGCHIAAGNAAYHGIPITATGDFEYRKSMNAAVSLHAGSVSKASLSGLLADSLIENFTSIDSMNVKVQWGGTASAHLAATVFGLHLEQLHADQIVAQATVSDKECIIDSLSFNAGNFNGFISGMIPFNESSGTTDLNFQIKCDRFPGSFKLKGSLLLSGSLNGSLTAPEVACRLIADNVSYDNLPPASLQCILKVSGDSCTISSVKNEQDTPLSFNGTIAHLFKKPDARFSALISSEPIKQLLARNYSLAETDSVQLSITANGWIDSYNAIITCHLRSKAVSGGVQIEANKRANDAGKIYWNMTTQKLQLSQQPAQASAGGYFSGGVVTIAHSELLDGITGTGTVELDKGTPKLNVRFDYRQKASSILGYLPDADQLLDSGIISGFTIVSGTPDSVATTSKISLDHIYKGGAGDFSLQATILTQKNDLTVLPFSLRLKSRHVISFDTVSYIDKKLSFRGTIDRFSPSMLSPATPDQASSLPEAIVTGSFATTAKGFPVEFSLTAPSISFATMHLDSVSCSGTLDTYRAVVSRCTFTDANRTAGSAKVNFPWTFINKAATEKDTLSGTVHLQGDLLATIGKNFDTPVSGNGIGTADLSFTNVGGVWKFSPGSITIPRGTLHVYPFVPDKVKNYTCQFTIDSTGEVHTDMSGTIKKRPIRIFSTHQLPDDIEPITIGPFDCGMLQVITPKKGVDLHLPGFFVKKDRGDIEFRGKGACKHFTLSGPLDKFKLTGTWFLRDLEFTFPLLADRDVGMASDPFPYITWDMDLKVGNRKVLYFWDLSGKKNRIVRFVDGYLDLSSHLRLRGRDLDKTFQVLGSIRSYKGAVYYGQVFDRNFDVGVEFHPQTPQKNQGYDNLPFLWGSAETFADTSRHKRVKLTCMIVDSVTGRVSEKGRLTNSPTPNISFHLSSDFDELAGESERDFYRQAGLTFTTIDGAGGAVTNFGEQMFHRYLLQRWERLVAKKLGLDVINIESSIVSNYFSKLYSRQFDGFLHQDDLLALANVGLTVGRYFFRDYLFLKARGELIPVDMMLTPEYSIGFEFQPSRYLLMDINYGFHKTETSFQHNPLLMLQLRLPITNLRKSFKF